MNWFRGSISEAIATSRQKKSLFVVVVTTDDEPSQKLLVNIEKNEVAEMFNNFVSVSLKNGSVEAQQFSQLYPIVILPSIYFIGLQGSPLEIIGGVVDSADLLARAKKALALHNGNAASPVENPTFDNSGMSSSPPIVTTETVPAESSSSSNETEPASEPAPLDERLDRANDLLAALRQKKIEEEREKEKEKERERRELGKQLQLFKQAQQEREQKELADARQKEKREEKEALEKIRQQIAQDRADRAARYQAEKASESQQVAAKVAEDQLKQQSAAAARNQFSRLQFRFPDGSTRTQQFSCEQKLSDVTSFIDREIKPSFKNYSLCLTFPRREFVKADMGKSLTELDLVPSAALMIVPSTSIMGRTTSSASPGVSWINWLLSPVNWVWALIMSFMFPPTNQPIQPSATMPPPAQPDDRATGGARRRRPQGNIRRLGDASADESDDNATWNGNSTQQL